jgi:multisubunit Na+/H+ antiporter MnhE subunit
MKRLYPVMLKLVAAILLASVTLGFSLFAVVVAYAVIEVIERFVGGVRTGKQTFGRIPRYAWFVADFAWDLLTSNVWLAIDVLTPWVDLYRVHFVRVDVSMLSPRQITLLCQRITLTPGTLACGLDEKELAIIVHLLYPIKGGDMAKRLRRPIDILTGGKYDA